MNTLLKGCQRGLNPQNSHGPARSMSIQSASKFKRSFFNTCKLWGTTEKPVLRELHSFVASKQRDELDCKNELKFSVQPGAVKLVLWRHWLHEIQVHPANTREPMSLHQAVFPSVVTSLTTVGQTPCSGLTLLRRTLFRRSAQSCTTHCPRSRGRHAGNRCDCCRHHRRHTHNSTPAGKMKSSKEYACLFTIFGQSLLFCQKGGAWNSAEQETKKPF